MQGLPLRQIYLNIVTDTLRFMNEHHLMHPPLLRAIALYVIVSLNNKVSLSSHTFKQIASLLDTQQKCLT